MVAIPLDSYLILITSAAPWDRDLVVRDGMGGKFFFHGQLFLRILVPGPRRHRCLWCKVAWCLHVAYKVLLGALNQLWNIHSTSSLW